MCYLPLKKKVVDFFFKYRNYFYRAFIKTQTSRFSNVFLLPAISKCLVGHLILYSLPYM